MNVKRKRMDIKSARVVPDGLLLEVPVRDAARVAYQFQAGEYELRKMKKHRSLDANAYAWVLIDKLASALGLPKQEVYRNSIRDIGGVSTTVCVKEEAADTLMRKWAGKGIGWQAEAFPSKLPGCVNVLLHYGSSAYDTHQMSALIDKLIQDCKALDIETMPPDKLAALLEEWNG